MRPRPVLKWHRPAAHVPVTMTQIPSGTKPGKPGVFFSAVSAGDQARGGEAPVPPPPFLGAPGPCPAPSPGQCFAEALLSTKNIAK